MIFAQALFSPAGPAMHRRRTHKHVWSGDGGGHINVIQPGRGAAVIIFPTHVGRAPLPSPPALPRPLRRRAAGRWRLLVAAAAACPTRCWGSCCTQWGCRWWGCRTAVRRSGGTGFGGDPAAAPQRRSGWPLLARRGGNGPERSRSGSPGRVETERFGISNEDALGRGGASCPVYLLSQCPTRLSFIL